MNGSLELDRRTVLCLAGGALLTLGVPRLAMAGAAPTLVLADFRYEVSVAFARARRGTGACGILPVGRDLAKLWAEIARLADQPPLTAEAVTLPADLFGLERLAEGSGGLTETKLAITGEGKPRRGAPKHLVYWRMRVGERRSASVG
jgi:hypothetical protein